MNEPEINCKYIFDKNYNPLYSNGAFGGVNSRGEIIINFFLERQPLPVKQSFKIDNGKFGEEIIEKRMPEDLQKSLVRFVGNGVVLNYENAKEVHRWLGEQITILESKIKNAK